MFIMECKDTVYYFIILHSVSLSIVSESRKLIMTYVEINQPK